MVISLLCLTLPGIVLCSTWFFFLVVCLCLLAIFFVVYRSLGTSVVVQQQQSQQELQWSCIVVCTTWFYLSLLLLLLSSCSKQKPLEPVWSSSSSPARTIVSCSVSGVSFLVALSRVRLCAFCIGVFCWSLGSLPVFCHWCMHIGLRPIYLRFDLLDLLE